MSYEPMLLLFVNRFLSFLYVSMDDAAEPFGRDDVEFCADDVFESDDDEEFSDPDDPDFEINDLGPADDDEDADEYAVLFELYQTIVKIVLASILMSNKDFYLNDWLLDPDASSEIGRFCESFEVASDCDDWSDVCGFLDAGPLLTPGFKPV